MDIEEILYNFGDTYLQISGSTDDVDLIAKEHEKLVNQTIEALATKLKPEERKRVLKQIIKHPYPCPDEYIYKDKPQLSAEEKEPIQNSLCETCLIVRDCKVRFSTMGIISKCGLYKPVCECGKPEPLKRIEELKYYWDSLREKPCVFPDTPVIIDKINELIQAFNALKGAERK